MSFSGMIGVGGIIWQRCLLNSTLMGLVINGKSLKSDGELENFKSIKYILKI